MATINFPVVDLNDPATLTYTQAGITWTWNETLGVWSSDLEGGSGGGGVPGDGVSVEVGETAPDNPSDGDLWFCTAETADGGGRLYVYYEDLTSNQWVDVSQPGTGIEYLSKTEDDTAAGSITFEGQTTHEGGVSVTGGDDTITNGMYRESNGNLKIKADRTVGIDFSGDSEDVKLNAFTLGGTFNAKTTEASGFRGNVNTNATTGEVNQFYTRFTPNNEGPIYRGFFCHSDVGAKNNATAFFTNMDKGDGTNYSFYADGNAPNFFKGGIVCKPLPTGSDNNSFIVSEAAGLFSSKYSNNNNHFCAKFTRERNDGSALTTERIIEFRNGSNDLVGAIKMDGSGSADMIPGSSDYRSKENIVDLPSATEAVQSLRPVNFNFKWAPGKTRPGFIAHEVSEVVPSAVLGEKDAVRTVGTYTSPSGEVETEVVEPEAIPYGATWVQTGVQDDYQSVDLKKLIPVLTKALQEVIAENEDIKARLAALEGA